MRTAIHSFVATAVLSLTAGSAIAALASGGKATASANLSTNPTTRKQQLLCDPGNEGDPLILTYAKLDVAIHLDTPIGVTAQQIVESIQCTPLAPFVPDPDFPLPFYNALDSESSFNVTFLPSGRDILITNLSVMANDPDLPPPGEIDHAIVDVQFNNLLPFDVYKNILGTYTVTTNSTSIIKGKDPVGGAITTFDAEHIDPATDNQVLGAPEPTMLAPLMMGIAGMFYRARRERRTAAH